MNNAQFTALNPGTLILNRYEILKIIGSGSMGTVYQCRDTKLEDRLVAVKLLHAELAKEQENAARFRREVIATYNVVHRNVVRTYEYLEDQDLQGLVMEHVTGMDLARILEEEEPIAFEAAIDLLLQIADGLQAIHDAGIVHRDVKPENIILTPDGLVKITDFGIARLKTAKSITETGSLMGTVHYLSPEYLSDAKVHALGDIYSMGVIAYELVAGRIPHESKTLMDFVSARIYDEPLPPAVFRPDCPASLNDAILRALSTDPERRTRSASEFAKELSSVLVSPFAESEEVEKPDKAPEEEGEDRASAAESDAQARDSYRPRRRYIPPEGPSPLIKRKPMLSWTALLLLCVLVLTVVLLATFLSSKRSILWYFRGGPSGWDRTAVSSEDIIKLRMSLETSYGTGEDAGDKKQSLENLQRQRTTKERHPEIVRAARDCNLKAVEDLLEKGEDVDKKDSNGETALSWAVRRHCVELVEVLLKRGANPHSRSHSGISPYNWSERYHYKDITALLDKPKS